MPSEPLKQSFLYKDGKAELFNDTEVEAKLADGWYDNPVASRQPAGSQLAAQPEVKPAPFVDPDDIGDGKIDGPVEPVSDENNVGGSTVPTASELIANSEKQAHTVHVPGKRRRGRPPKNVT